MEYDDKIFEELEKEFIEEEFKFWKLLIPLGVHMSNTINEINPPMLNMRYGINFEKIGIEKSYKMFGFEACNGWDDTELQKPQSAEPFTYRQRR